MKVWLVYDIIPAGYDNTLTLRVYGLFTNREKATQEKEDIYQSYFEGVNDRVFKKYGSFGSYSVRIMEVETE